MRFYRIDITKDAVDPPRFFALAYRLPAYEGVLTARIQEEQEESKKHSPSKALRSGDPNVTVIDDAELRDLMNQ